MNSWVITNAVFWISGVIVEIFADAGGGGLLFASVASILLGIFYIIIKV